MEGSSEDDLERESAASKETTFLHFEVQTDGHRMYCISFHLLYFLTHSTWAFN